MKKPTTIINYTSLDDLTKISPAGSWGTTDPSNGKWYWEEEGKTLELNKLLHEGEVLSGESVRKWVQKKLSIYGPYNSKEEAAANVPNKWKPGTTVGIWEDGRIKEYQWKDSENLTAEDLEIKVEDTTLTISIPTGADSVSENSDGKTFSLTYVLKGRTILREGRLLLNGVQVDSFSPMISNEGVTENFTLPNTIGIYQYQLQIIDIFGQSVTSDFYTLSYGTISARFDTSAIRIIVPKTPAQLEGAFLSAEVNTIDRTMYIPNKIMFGNSVLYTFTGTEAFPWTGDFLLPGDLLVGENICAKLIYNTNQEILDTYNFTIVDSNSASVEVEEDFIQGYIGKRLSFPFKINSGNSTFRFNATLTISNLNYPGAESVSYTYTNGAGNRTLDFVVLNLLPLLELPAGETSHVYPATLNILETSNPSINDTVSFNITVNKVIVNDPYKPTSNYFIFNTNKNLLFRNAFTSSIIEPKNSPVTYYSNQDTITSNGSPQRFVLDLYVNISKSGQNKTIVNITSGQDILAQIKEETVNVGNLTTDLYLDNNYKHIGIVYNRLEESIITEESVNYSAIYIDGKLVVNEVLTDPITISNPITITINPNTNAVFDLASIHVYGYGQNDDSQVFTVKSTTTSGNNDLLYYNYVSNLATAPDSNSILHLKLININNVLNEDEEYQVTVSGVIETRTRKRFLGYNKKLDHLVPIGEIGDKQAGIVSALLLMRTDYKKTKLQNGLGLQKGLATFCYYELTKLNGDVENGVVEVHTQGTSTLDYSIPNLAFTFYSINLNNDGLTKVQKSIVSDIPESTLTAKADYMDSSHLNNTPTCIFINEITANTEIISNLSLPRKTNYNTTQNKYLDAILGEPCIIEYTDINPETTEFSGLSNDLFGQSSFAFVNMGSFMLNVDKSGKSLGLDIVENTGYLHDNEINVCYSLEGKSNIDTPDELGSENPNAALFRYTDSIRSQGVPDLDWDFSYENDWELLSLKQLDALYKFIFDGAAFEFRSDIDPEEWYEFEQLSGEDIILVYSKVGDVYLLPNNDNIIYVEYKDKTTGEYIGHKQYSTTTKANLLKYLYPIARMWYFVAKSSDGDFYSHFDEYFNRQYAFLYYINLMNFAQVDNLGKNSMFDTWDGLIWYPRPYDLDSQCGLTNLGVDSIKTYEEILPTDTFITNYNGKTDLNNNVEEGVYTIQQAIDALDNKHYSSKTSNLWSKLWRCFGVYEIPPFYLSLRENGYSVENIINNARNCVINKIPADQYNIDFRNKYLGAAEADQLKAFGDRWDKFRVWITKRFAFCDTYFGYTNIIDIASSSANYLMHIDTPQYVKVTTDANDFGRQLALTYANIAISTGVNHHIKVNTDNVTEITNLNTATYFTMHVTDSNSAANNDGVDKKLNNLLWLDISGNQYFLNLSSISTQFNFLHTLNISDSRISSIGTLPKTVLNFYADNVTFLNNPLVGYNSEDAQYYSKITSTDSRLIDLSLKGYNGALVLKDMPLLERVDLTGATLSYLRLENLPNLKTLILEDCRFNGDVVVENISKEELDFSNCNFNGNNLDFSGQTSTIKRLKLNNVKNLSSVVLDTLTQLQVLDCTGSSIEQIILNEPSSTINTLKCSTEIKKIGPIDVADYTADMQNFTALSLVSFDGARYLQYIRNLIYTGSGENMCRRCLELLLITNSNIHITTNCNYMFSECIKLNTISSLVLSNPSGGTNITKANYTFTKTHSLPMSTVMAILNSISTITEFTATCAYKKNIGYSVSGKGSTTLNLGDFFLSNLPISADRTFNQYHALSGVTSTLTAYETNTLGMANYRSASNLTRIVGKFPASITSVATTFSGNNNLTTVDYDMFENATRLVTASITFSDCNLLNFVDSSNTNIGLTDSFFGVPAEITGAEGDDGKRLTSLFSCFANNANLTLDLSNVNIFSRYTQLTNIAAVFQGCPNVSGDCKLLFRYNRSLNRMENAFNGTKVYLTGTLFDSEYSNPIYIGGLFANHVSYNPGGNVGGDKINVEFITQLRNISSLSAYTNYAANNSTPALRNGLFEGCANFDGSWDNIKNILVGKDCRRLFAGSEVHLIFDSDIEHLLIPNCSDISYMFEAANFSSLSDLNEITFGLTANLIGTFRRSLFYAQNEFTINFVEGNKDMSYLFAACNINYDIENLDLPQSVENTKYMFAATYTTTYTESQNESTIDTRYNGSLSLEDIREGGTRYSLSGSSNITGAVPIFGNSEKLLDNLKNIDHMFDSSAVTSIKGGMLHYCPSIVNCRYVFCRCYALTLIDGSVINIAGTDQYVLNIFSGTYNDLKDVTGMFKSTSLSGTIYISLITARNLRRADCMFEYILSSTYTTPISFGVTLFDNNNSQLRSISHFAYGSRMATPPSLVQILGNLAYANYAFAYCGVTDARIFGTATSTTLRSIVGMFANNSGLIDEMVDIQNATIPLNTVITGNFYLCDGIVQNGNNKSKALISIAISKSSYNPTPRIFS